MCTTHKESLGGQKMELDPQRLELQMAVTSHVGAEKGAQGLWENSQCSYPRDHLSSPRHFNFKRITGLQTGGAAKSSCWKHRDPDYLQTHSKGICSCHFRLPFKTSWHLLRVLGSKAKKLIWASPSRRKLMYKNSSRIQGKPTINSPAPLGFHFFIIVGLHNLLPKLEH